MSLKEHPIDPWSNKVFCISLINVYISTTLRPECSCNLFVDFGVNGTLWSVSTQSLGSSKLSLFGKLSTEQWRWGIVFKFSFICLLCNVLIGVVISTLEDTLDADDLIILFWSKVIDTLALVLKSKVKKWICMYYF